MESAALQHRREVDWGSMVRKSSKVNMHRAVAAHEGYDRDEMLRLRTLSAGERGAMIEAACAAAAEIYRSRLAAGLADVDPAPWPDSTWEFLRKHAADVRR
jgi:hypothetical protein